MRKNCPQVILENFFEPCILYLLLKKASYGYEINKNLKERCGCEVNVGNLYRCLAKLQKQKYVSKKKSQSKIGPDRYIYAITSSGKNLLEEWIENLNRQKNVINKLINNYRKIV